MHNNITISIKSQTKKKSIWMGLAKTKMKKMMIKKMKIVKMEERNLSKSMEVKILYRKTLLFKKISNLPKLKLHLRKLNLMNYLSCEKLDEFP